MMALLSRASCTIAHDSVTITLDPEGKKSAFQPDIRPNPANKRIFTLERYIVIRRRGWLLLQNTPGSGFMNDPKIDQSKSRKSISQSPENRSVKVQKIDQSY